MNPDIYFLFVQKKLFLLEMLDPYLGIKAGIIVDANIGNKKLNIPDPF